MKLSKREIILLYVLVVALIIFAAVTFVIKPMAETLSANADREIKLREELRLKEYEADYGQSLSGKIDLIKEEIEAGRAKFLPYMNDTELFAFIERYYFSRGFVCASYLCGGETDVGGGLFSVTVSLRLNAEFEDKQSAVSSAEDFVSGIYEYLGSGSVRQASWRAEAGAESVVCDININFSIYMSKP